MPSAILVPLFFRCPHVQVNETQYECGYSYDDTNLPGGVPMKCFWCHVRPSCEHHIATAIKNNNYGVHLFAKFEDYTSQCLACRCVKSLFRRCLAARAAYTMLSWKGQKKNPPGSSRPPEKGCEYHISFSHQTPKNCDRRRYEKCKLVHQNRSPKYGETGM